MKRMIITQRFRSVIQLLVTNRKFDCIFINYNVFVGYNPNRHNQYEERGAPRRRDYEDSRDYRDR